MGQNSTLRAQSQNSDDQKIANVANVPITINVQNINSSFVDYVRTAIVQNEPNLIN